MNAISVSKSAQFRKTRRVHPHVCVQYDIKHYAMSHRYVITTLLFTIINKVPLKGMDVYVCVYSVFVLSCV
jgi:hypothetical protein